MLRSTRSLTYIIYKQQCKSKLLKLDDTYIYIEYITWIKMMNLAKNLTVVAKITKVAIATSLAAILARSEPGGRTTSCIV